MRSCHSCLRMLYPMTKHLTDCYFPESQTLSCRVQCVHMPGALRWPGFVVRQNQRRPYVSIQALLIFFLDTANTPNNTVPSHSSESLSFVPKCFYSVNPATRIYSIYIPIYYNFFTGGYLCGVIPLISRTRCSLRTHTDAQINTYAHTQSGGLMGTSVANRHVIDQVMKFSCACVYVCVCGGVFSHKNMSLCVQFENKSMDYFSCVKLCGIAFCSL